MLMFIAGALAAVVVLAIVCVCIAASSGSSRYPYAGTPAYHLSGLDLSIGAVSCRSTWKQTDLTASLKLTPLGGLEWTLAGTPDAVLQGLPYMTDLTAMMIQASRDYTRAPIRPGHSYPAVASGYNHPPTSYRPLSGATKMLAATPGLGQDPWWTA